MTISELICRLHAVKCEHGDLKVAVLDGHDEVDLAGNVVIEEPGELAFIHEKCVGIYPKS